MVTVKGPGQLHVGEGLDPGSGERNGEPTVLDSADFTTHGVIVGMTGSGKTGLGIVLLEEVLLSGVPVLAIDPKGDLGNLLLTFPSLDATSFEPWMDEGEARIEGVTVSDLAGRTADRWRAGLAGWGLDGSDVERLGSAARGVIYTPGGTAGVPLDVLGRLDPPTSEDPAVRQDEVDATASGLLGLVGVESDPLSGREHILLGNLISRAWEDGRPLDLASLLALIIDPPMRKLGVLDLDTFFPPRDRQELVMKLNGLLASPGFAAWATGAPIDPATMLWDADGHPRAAVVSLRHLEENERHFAITILLSRLISWMRSQSGTGQLRCLVYIDEVMGLAPPVGNPSTKKPILTLLKQARAFGVGLVLSTQNPVDLDYKAISNAGTWMIGRLQTEQDKNRLVDGLRAADGTVDVRAIENQISGLGKRQFILRTTRSADLPLFTTRWAMSYLAGPLSRDQIARLMSDRRPDSPDDTGGPAAPAGDLGEDESTIAPPTPTEVPVRFVSSGAPWLQHVGGHAGATRLVPMVAARLSLVFDETKADLRHSEEWEALVPVAGDHFDTDQRFEVDFDDRDFLTEPPPGVSYVVPEFNITKTLLRRVEKDLRNEVYASRELTLLHNPELKLFSRPGEDRSSFEQRCRAAAEEGSDADAAALRSKLEGQMGRIQDRIAKAEDRLQQARIEADGRSEQQWVNVGTSILGGLLGGRRGSRSLASAARRMSSGRRQATAARNRVETAMNRLEEQYDDLEELEAKLAESLVDIDDEWTEKAEAISEFGVGLEKSDVTVSDLMIVWVPTASD